MLTRKTYKQPKSSVFIADFEHLFFCLEYFFADSVFWSKSRPQNKAAVKMKKKLNRCRLKIEVSSTEYFPAAS